MKLEISFESTNHDFEIDNTPDFPLLPIGPSEVGIKRLEVLPVGIDILFFQFFNVLAVPETFSSGYLHYVSLDTPWPTNHPPHRDRIRVHFSSEYPEL